MLGQPKFDTKNLSVELRSREKHDEVSLSNIHENTSNNEGGKRIFLQMGDLFEFPCKKKLDVRRDEDLFFSSGGGYYSTPPRDMNCLG